MLQVPIFLTAKGSGTHSYQEAGPSRPNMTPTFQLTPTLKVTTMIRMTFVVYATDSAHMICLKLHSEL